MVSRPHRRRAAKGERLCEWRKRALPRCQRIERPRSRISWPLGRRGLGRSFRQPSRDADAIKHAELRAETFYTDSAGYGGTCCQLCSGKTRIQNRSADCNTTRIDATERQRVSVCRATRNDGLRTYNLPAPGNPV